MVGLQSVGSPTCGFMIRQSRSSSGPRRSAWKCARTCRSRGGGRLPVVDRRAARTGRRQHRADGGARRTLDGRGHPQASTRPHRKGLRWHGLLITDDVQASYEELTARGVDYNESPNQMPSGIDSGFRDPSGNSVRLTQLNPQAAYLDSPGAEIEAFTPTSAPRLCSASLGQRPRRRSRHHACPYLHQRSSSSGQRRQPFRCRTIRLSRQVND
jgi:hypothetical protein